MVPTLNSATIVPLASSYFPKILNNLPPSQKELFPLLEEIGLIDPSGHFTRDPNQISLNLSVVAEEKSELNPKGKTFKDIGDERLTSIVNSSIIVRKKIEAPLFTIELKTLINKWIKHLEKTFNTPVHTYLKGSTANYVIPIPLALKQIVEKFLKIKYSDNKELFDHYQNAIFPLLDQMIDDWKKLPPSYIDVDLMTLISNTSPSKIKKEWLQFLSNETKIDSKTLLSKSFNALLIPSKTALTKKSEDYLFFSMGDSHLKIDYVTGFIDPFYLFERDNLKIELLMMQNGDICFSPPFIPPQTVFDYSLKIVRFEKRHIGDFRGYLSAIFQLAKGGKLDGLTELLEAVKEYIPLLSQPHYKKELLKAINRKIEDHPKETLPFLLTYLYYFEMCDESLKNEKGIEEHYTDLFSLNDRPCNQIGILLDKVEDLIALKKEKSAIRLLQKGKKFFTNELQTVVTKKYFLNLLKFYPEEIAKYLLENDFTEEELQQYLKSSPFSLKTLEALLNKSISGKSETKNFILLISHLLTQGEIKIAEHWIKAHGHKLKNLSELEKALINFADSSHQKVKFYLFLDSLRKALPKNFPLMNEWLSKHEKNVPAWILDSNSKEEEILKHLNSLFDQDKIQEALSDLSLFKERLKMETISKLLITQLNKVGVTPLKLEKFFPFLDDLPKDALINKLEEVKKWEHSTKKWEVIFKLSDITHVEIDLKFILDELAVVPKELKPSLFPFLEPPAVKMAKKLYDLKDYDNLMELFKTLFSLNSGAIFDKTLSITFYEALLNSKMSLSRKISFLERTFSNFQLPENDPSVKEILSKILSLTIEHNHKPLFKSFASQLIKREKNEKDKVDLAFKLSLNEKKTPPFFLILLEILIQESVSTLNEEIISFLPRFFDKEYAVESHIFDRLFELLNELEFQDIKTLEFLGQYAAESGARLLTLEGVYDGIYELNGNAPPSPTMIFALLERIKEGKETPESFFRQIVNDIEIFNETSLFPIAIELIYTKPKLRGSYIQARTLMNELLLRKELSSKTLLVWLKFEKTNSHEQLDNLIELLEIINSYLKNSPESKNSLNEIYEKMMELTLTLPIVEKVKLFEMNFTLFPSISQKEKEPWLTKLIDSLIGEISDETFKNLKKLLQNSSAEPPLIKFFLNLFQNDKIHLTLSKSELLLEAITSYHLFKNFSSPQEIKLFWNTIALEMSSFLLTLPQEDTSNWLYLILGVQNDILPILLMKSKTIQAQNYYSSLTKNSSKFEMNKEFLTTLTTHLFKHPLNHTLPFTDFLLSFFTETIKIKGIEASLFSLLEEFFFYFKGLKISVPQKNAITAIMCTQHKDALQENIVKFILDENFKDIHNREPPPLILLIISSKVKKVNSLSVCQSLDEILNFSRKYPAEENFSLVCVFLEKLIREGEFATLLLLPKIYTSLFREIFEFSKMTDDDFFVWIATNFPPMLEIKKQLLKALEKEPLSVQKKRKASIEDMLVSLLSEALLLINTIPAKGFYQNSETKRLQLQLEFLELAYLKEWIVFDKYKEAVETCMRGAKPLSHPDPHYGEKIDPIYLTLSSPKKTSAPHNIKEELLVLWCLKNGELKSLHHTTHVLRVLIHAIERGFIQNISLSKDFYSILIDFFDPLRISPELLSSNEKYSFLLKIAQFAFIKNLVNKTGFLAQVEEIIKSAETAEVDESRPFNSLHDYLYNSFYPMHYHEPRRELLIPLLPEIIELWINKNLRESSISKQMHGLRLIVHTFQNGYFFDEKYQYLAKKAIDLSIQLKTTSLNNYSHTALSIPAYIFGVHHNIISYEEATKILVPYIERLSNIEPEITSPQERDVIYTGLHKPIFIEKNNNGKTLQLDLLTFWISLILKNNTKNHRLHACLLFKHALESGLLAKDSPHSIKIKELIEKKN